MEILFMKTIPCKIYNNLGIKDATTSHNRSVCASPPYGGSGYEKPQSGYALYAVFLRHIFCALETLRVSFIAYKKHRIQPER